MAELNADIINCVPLYAVEGTPLAAVSPPTAERIASIRRSAGQFLPVMAHCTRCRADAAGLLGEPPAAGTLALLAQSAALPLDPAEDRPYVAVATREGILVNQHLGEASQLAIFGRGADGFHQVATRAAPPAGGGRQRWTALAETLRDCRALLVASARGFAHLRVGRPGHPRGDDGRADRGRAASRRTETWKSGSIASRAPLWFRVRRQRTWLFVRGSDKTGTGSEQRQIFIATLVRREVPVPVLPEPQGVFR